MNPATGQNTDTMKQIKEQQSLETLFENYNQAKAACFDAAADISTPLETIRELSLKYNAAWKAFYKALPKVEDYTGPVIPVK